MAKWKKIVIIAAVSFVALTALVFLALPPLLRHVAVSKIDQATGRKTRIDRIALNPFTLKAEVSGFRLSEKGSEVSFFSFSSARLSLSPLSLPKRSFIITEAHLASPYLHLVRNAPNRFNFSDMLTEKKEPRKKEGTPYFSLNNITINNGSIDFQDKALSQLKNHRLDRVNIAIPFVSNMPYLADRYVQPHFDGMVNGSLVRLDGRLKPLTRAVEATVALNLNHVDVPFYLGYLPSPPPVQVPSGTLATALEVGYRVHEKTGPELRVSGDAVLEKAALREQDGAPLAAADRIALKIREIALLSRRAEIGSLELDGMELYAARDRRGVWNFSRLSAAKTEQPAAPPAKATAAKPFEVKLGKLALKGGKVHLSDAQPPGGFRSDLRGIDVSIDNFVLGSKQAAPFELRLASSRGESVVCTGQVAAAPVDLKATLSLKDVPLKDYYPYLKEILSAPVTGKVSLNSDIVYNESQGVVLQKASLKGEGLSAPFAPGEGLRLNQVGISGINVDLKRNKAEVERADLKGGSLIFSGEQDGRMSYQRLFRSGGKEAAAAREPTATRKRQAAKSAPFSYRIKKATGSDLAVTYTDRTKEGEPRFALSGLRFAVSDITGPKLGGLPIVLSAGYGKNGHIRANGNLNTEPVGFKGNIDLHGIQLRDFDPYIPDDTTVFIADGALDTRLALDVQKASPGVKGSFGGNLTVRSFYCQDTNLNEDLLKWEHLQVDQVKGTLSPFTLAISDVSLSNFYSRVIIEKDGTLNLQHLREEEEAEGAPKVVAHAETAKVAPSPPGTPAPVVKVTETTTVTRTQTSAAAKGAESATQPHPIRIDSITMQGGTLNFSDRHLDAPFDTTFYNLGGRVSGLSSQSNRFADVDLRGNLENHSPLFIKGVINPLRGDLYLDMKVTFTDIELSPLTPYSNTYLGYNMDKGKLFLNLSYKIDKKSLSSENKVFIDQFTFGKQVESAKATKLPVRLAVALLKDRKGEIHLDLPVAGRTDDPKFSVWKVVLQILKNLLVKAATSPLALLGSLAGGGEDFSAVVFEPGSERLSKPEQEKLVKLAKALQDRPALNVDISAFVERERDAEGYRNEVLLKKMKGEKFRKLVKEGKMKEGQTQQETEILPDEYRVYLKEVYVKEKFSKPRNALGFLKDLPEAEMKKLIITHTVVGQNELQALARERAAAVKAFLVQEGKIPPERIFEKSADIYKPPAKDGMSASRVEFGAGVK